MNYRTHAPRQTGVTLVELLISVALLGVIAIFSVQTYGSLMVKTQISAQSNLFIASLHNARAEAINRNERVTICRANTSYNACITTAGTWEKGWIMFVDTDRDATIDAGETILQTQAAFEGKNVLKVENGQSEFVNYISYTQSGYTRATGTGGGIQGGSLFVCGKIKAGLNTSESKIGTEIVIAVTGTPRTNVLSLTAPELSNCP